MDEQHRESIFPPQYENKTSVYMWWIETIVIILINVVFLFGFIIWVSLGLDFKSFFLT